MQEKQPYGSSEKKSTYIIRFYTTCFTYETLIMVKFSQQGRPSFWHPIAEVFYVRIYLKEIRTLRGISLRRLSKKSGVSIGQLSKIENHESIPTVKTMCDITNALGLELSDVVSCKEKVVGVNGLISPYQHKEEGPLRTK